MSNSGPEIENEVERLLLQGYSDVTPEKPNLLVWDKIQAAVVGVGNQEIAPSDDGDKNVAEASVVVAEDVVGRGNDSAASLRVVNGEANGSPNLAETETKAGWLPSRVSVLAVAAAVVLLAGIGAAIAELSSDSQQAELLAMANHTGFGTAELNDSKLTVDLDIASPPANHFHEVWLLNTDDAGEVIDLRSLGKVGDDGFVVPKDLDISAFNVVDVSLEPDDSDKDHSGDSVLRGSLKQL